MSISTHVKQPYPGRVPLSAAQQRRAMLSKNKLLELRTPRSRFAPLKLFRAHTLLEFRILKEARNLKEGDHAWTSIIFPSLHMRHSSGAL
jgi:hypothetical protein